MTAASSSTSATNLKIVLSSIFRRKGGAGQHIQLFDDMPRELRSALLDEIPLTQDEAAVIGYNGPDDSRLLLTTERLVWGRHCQFIEVRIDEIDDVKIDLSRIQSAEDKASLKTLELSADCRKFSLALEPGLGLSGLWNVLHHLAVRNRRARD